VITLAALLGRYSAAIADAARDPSELVTPLLVRDAVTRALHSGELFSRAD